MTSMSKISGGEQKETSKVGLTMALAIGALAIGGSIAAIPFLTPAMRKHALPYVPATTKQLDNVFKAISVYTEANNLNFAKPTQKNLVKLVDLGSGDGRIVFEAADRGYQATGIELNSVLWFYSCIKALTYKTPDGIKPLFRPKFKRADLWKVNMNSYDLIIVFGVQEMMKDLAKKIDAEMKPATLIVSCRYPISYYKSAYNLEDELDSVWIYNKESLTKFVPPAEQTEKLRFKKAKNEDDDDD